MFSSRFYVGVLALLASTGAWAAGSPDRTLTMVVPAGPGSAPDIIARVLADELRTRLDQPTVVENKSGAGGIVAVMAAKTSPGRDTLLLAQAAVVTVTPLTYRAAKYDLATDMEPVAVVADTPMMIVANPATGPKTLAEAVAQAKTRSGQFPVTSPARGSIPNLTVELLAQATGVSVNLVPMGGSGQSIQAVANGDALMAVDGVAPLLPLVRSGRLRALAVTSPRPLKGLEAYPLASETVPGLQATGWFMLFAKKGTPPARLQLLNDAVNEALKSPDLQQKLANTANYPVGGSLESARSFLQREKQLWAGAVKKAGLQPE